MLINFNNAVITDSNFMRVATNMNYDESGQNVRIECNDYRNQKQGQAAPKKYRDLSPLIAMQMLLQHQLPLYFQKVRHYGLHAAVVYKKVKDQIPD